jgi:hypothetical protein
MLDIELIVRFLIELSWIFASIYGIKSTKLHYWKQCWYIILAGSVVHTIYIFLALGGITYAPGGISYAGIFRNLGMAIVAVGIIMLARRTKNILG